LVFKRYIKLYKTLLNLFSFKTNLLQKAICIYKLVRNESTPIDLQLKMFDSMIEPILMYGSEVWGYENFKVIEQIQIL
jgi:hypothetical protein